MLGSTGPHKQFHSKSLDLWTGTWSYEFQVVVMFYRCYIMRSQSYERIHTSCKRLRFHCLCKMKVQNCRNHPFNEVTALRLSLQIWLEATNIESHPSRLSCPSSTFHDKCFLLDKPISTTQIVYSIGEPKRRPRKRVCCPRPHFLVSHRCDSETIQQIRCKNHERYISLVYTIIFIKSVHEILIISCHVY